MLFSWNVVIRAILKCINFFSWEKNNSENVKYDTVVCYLANHQMLVSLGSFCRNTTNSYVIIYVTTVIVMSICM